MALKNYDKHLKMTMLHNIVLQEYSLDIFNKYDWTVIFEQDDTHVTTEERECGIR